MRTWSSMGIGPIDCALRALVLNAIIINSITAKNFFIFMWLNELVL